MEAKSFASPAGFRASLVRHHARGKELLLRCSKFDAAARGVTYAQALNEATRLRRLETLIAAWGRGEPIPPLARLKSRPAPLDARRAGPGR